MKTTTKQDINTKSGKLIPANTEVNVVFGTSMCAIEYMDVKVSCSYMAAHKYLNKFQAPPTDKKLENMGYASVVPSVIGNRVEPDGKGPEGDPSWLLVMGVI